MDIKYYDREGKVIDLVSFGRLHNDLAYKRVASTHVGKLWVSTVWLGTDHSFGRGQQPLIFETMVFNQDDDDNAWGDEEICERYCTEEEALAGHQRIIDRLQYVIEEVPTLI